MNASLLCTLPDSTISLRLLAAQHQLGDGRQLHVRRALVDLADLAVAEIFLDGIILGEAVAAVDLLSSGRGRE